ncbi:unnamed protein product [Adineta ricciae]|uniref:Uncharacterized protein n=1 Tax=Adineta ricciae TaxID=249248 RepID=A0A815GUD5_ADIRI|nr:unnamed protein product [Adineta ricciae]
MVNSKFFFIHLDIIENQNSHNDPQVDHFGDWIRLNLSRFRQIPCRRIPVGNLQEMSGQFLTVSSPKFAGNDGFKIGRIIEIHDNYFLVQLFHYKLDVKCENITEDEILVNFGGNGSKSIFDFDHNRQMILSRKMKYMNSDTSMSLIAIIADLEENESGHSRHLCLFDSFPVLR